MSKYKRECLRLCEHVFLHDGPAAERRVVVRVHGAEFLEDHLAVRIVGHDDGIRDARPGHVGGRNVRVRDADLVPQHAVFGGI